MAYTGWMTFGGVEVFNTPRTTAYAHSLVPRLSVKGCAGCDALPELLGHGEYTLPEGDEAPWYDENNSDSFGFAGLYPLSVTGLDDDTRTAEVTEGAADGGFISPVRRSTREVRVSGLLIANSAASLEYGRGWLSMLLNNGKFGPTVGRSGSGIESQSVLKNRDDERADVRFLATCPDTECSGDPVVHSIPLNQLIAIGGTLVGTTWTPNNSYSQLRTPVIDSPCGEVVYNWTVTAANGVTTTLRTVQDTTLRDSEGPRALTRTNLAQNPNAVAVGTIEARRNRSTNPRATAAGAGFTDNLPNPVTTKGVAITGHPLGITTAAKSVVTVAGSTLLNQYNPDTLGASGTARGVGCWLFAPKASTATLYLDGNQAGTTRTIALPANTWTWLNTTAQATGSAILSVTQNTASIVGDWAMVTGVVAEVSANGTGPLSFFDGDIPDTYDLDYQWTGSAGISASIAVGRSVPTSQSDASVYQRTSNGRTWYATQYGSYLYSFGTGIVGHYYSVTLRVAGPPGSTANLGTSDNVVGSFAANTTVVIPDSGEIEVTMLASAAAGGTTLSAGITSGAGFRQQFITGMLIEEVSGIGVAPSGPSFSGDTTDGFDNYDYAWAGAAYGSASTATSRPVATGTSFTEGVLYSELSSSGPVTVTSVTATYPDPVTLTAAAASYWRTLRDVKCIEGPTVVQEYTAGAAHLQRVEFLMTAEDPWLYGDEVLVASMATGVATYSRVDAPFSTYVPGTVSLYCYATMLVGPPADPNCAIVPTAPRPPYIEACSADQIADKGALFFIPDSLLPKNMTTFPILVFNYALTGARKDNTFIRVWPLPFAGATLSDIAACDTRGSLVVTFISNSWGYTLDPSRHRGTVNHYSVPGETIDIDGTHLVQPPVSLAAVPGEDFDPLPVEWPVLTGGGFGYYVLVETKSTAQLSMSLKLVTRQ